MELGPDGKIKALDLPDDKLEKIRSEFVRGLEFPDKKHVPQFFLCPVGRIGAGKSTVVRVLMRHFPLLCVANDDARKILYKHGYNFNRARDITWPVLEHFAREGYSIAIDSNCASDAARKIQPQFNSLVRELGAKVIYVYVNPPDEYIINKLRTYPHRWLFKDGEHAVARYRARKPEKPVYDIPFMYTFDPSRDDFEKQIREAVRIIKNELAA